MSGWSLASATDVGRVRSANEDSLGTRGNLAVVADGMGGHAAGEVASGIAVATFLERASTATTLDELTDAVRAANLAILDNVAENPDRWGMGTTLVATVATVLGSLFADVLYAAADPRIRLSGDN